MKKTVCFVVGILAFWTGLFDLAHASDQRKDSFSLKNLDGLDVSYRGVNKNFADAVKASGLELHIYTVNDLDEAKRLKKLGVDGITTDRPGWLLEHLQ